MMILRELFIVNLIIYGFAFLFNAPLKTLPKAGLGGSVGWLVFLASEAFIGSVVISSFLGTMTIALLGEVFSVVDRKPITVFIVPGIVPFVPGFGIYNTMLAVVEQDYPLALYHGSNTFFIGLAIAFALTIMLSINTYRRRKKAAKRAAASPDARSRALADIEKQFEKELNRNL